MERKTIFGKACTKQRARKKRLKKNTVTITITLAKDICVSGDDVSEYVCYLSFLPAGSTTPMIEK